MLSRSHITSLFIKILLLQVLLLVIMGTKKTSFFVDEIWTYNLANSYYFPAIGDASDFFNMWLPGSFWFNLLTVSPEHSFNYASVWYNQSVDVHPPLFYSVVHTVCGFFPGEFSKWFIIVPNICFFVATQIFLLLISIKLFTPKYMALMPCLFYGFTLGAVNSVLYLRMYMLLTLWCMASIYVHLWHLEMLHQDKTIAKHYYAALFCAYLGGFLTHYYFVVYAFFLSLVYGCYVLSKKHYEVIKCYLLASVGAFIISVAIFPAMLKHIFGYGDSGYRGAEALGNLYGSAFSTKLAAFLGFVRHDLGGDLMLMALWVLIFVALWKFIQVFVQIKLLKQPEGYKLTMDWQKPQQHYEFTLYQQTYLAVYILLSSLLCFFVITKVTEIDDNRYIFMLYPAIVVTAMYFIGGYVDYLSQKQYVKIAVVVVLTFLSVLPAMKQGNIKAQDNNMQPAITEVAEKYSDVPLIAVCQYESWHPIIEKALLLNKVEQTYLIKAEKLMQVEVALNALQKKPEQLLIFLTWDKEKKYPVLLEEVKQYTGFTKSEKLYESGNQHDRGQLYLLKK